MTRDRFQLEPFGRPRKPNVIEIAKSIASVRRDSTAWRSAGHSLRLRVRAIGAVRSGRVAMASRARAAMRLGGDRAYHACSVTEHPDRAAEVAKALAAASVGPEAYLPRSVARWGERTMASFVDTFNAWGKHEPGTLRRRAHAAGTWMLDRIPPHETPLGALPPVCTSVEMVHPANVSTLEARAALARLVGEMTDATRRGMLWNAACVPLTMPLMLTPISNFPAYWFGWRAWTQRRASGAGRALRRVVEMSDVRVAAWRARERLEGWGRESPSDETREIRRWVVAEKPCERLDRGRSDGDDRACCRAVRAPGASPDGAPRAVRGSTTRAARSRPRVESLEVGVGSRRSSGRCTRRG